MSTLQETLDKIATIALGNSAEVVAEVAAVKSTVADITAKISANEAADADLKTIVEALVDKLAAAPAPVDETPADDTVVS